MLGPPAAATTAPDTTRVASPAAKAAWGDDGFTFGDLVDIVNPLQHVPILSWAYRALSGDAIAPAARVLGGTLFGGAAGLALSAADTALERFTGRDVGGTAVAMLHGRGSMPSQAPEGILVAQQDAAPAAPGAEQGLTEHQFERLVRAFGTAPAAAPTPVWQTAVANMPDDQIAILLRSVGLPPRATAAATTAEATATPEPAVAIVPAGSVATSSFPAMPALPVAAVAITGLAPPAAALRDERLADAAAAGEELRRLFAVPR